MGIYFIKDDTDFILFFFIDLFMFVSKMSKTVDEGNLEIVWNSLML